ncbi:MAG TPA: anthranilate phosphoribosyltransferase [Trueperaceae bacterium]
MSEEFDVASLLGRVFDGETLERDEARDVMGRLMDGKLSQVQAAALLAALRTRGETVEEIIGFAQAMRERAVPVRVSVDGPLVDTCGTGGTGLNVFNVSTTATFLAAALGVRVAKHGNVGVTRPSGSADVLRAAGANLDLTGDAVARAIETVGVGFIFARNHHPAMRFVAPIRADLKARTIFNNLGPLTNPAGAQRQLMGVFSPDLARLLAEVLRGLGVERALVVHGDGLDDLTVTGPSSVTELRADGSIEEYEVAPEDLGVGRHPAHELAGGGPEENAAIMRRVLGGGAPAAASEVVALNAGAAAYLAGLAPDLRSGVAAALEALRSGAGLSKLDEYVAFTRDAAAA